MVTGNAFATNNGSTVDEETAEDRISAILTSHNNQIGSVKNAITAINNRFSNISNLDLVYERLGEKIDILYDRANSLKDIVRAQEPEGYSDIKSKVNSLEESFLSTSELIDQLDNLESVADIKEKLELLKMKLMAAAVPGNNLELTELGICDISEAGKVLDEGVKGTFSAVKLSVKMGGAAIPFTGWWNKTIGIGIFQSGRDIFTAIKDGDSLIITVAGLTTAVYDHQRITTGSDIFIDINSVKTVYLSGFKTLSFFMNNKTCLIEDYDIRYNKNGFLVIGQDFEIQIVVDDLVEINRDNDWYVWTINKLNNSRGVVKKTGDIIRVSTSVENVTVGNKNVFVNRDSIENVTKLEVKGTATIVVDKTVPMKTLATATVTDNPLLLPGWIISDGIATYHTAGSTEGFVFENDKTLVFHDAEHGTDIVVVSNLKETTVAADLVYDEGTVTLRRPCLSNRDIIVNPLNNVTINVMLEDGCTPIEIPGSISYTKTGVIVSAAGMSEGWVVKEQGTRIVVVYYSENTGDILADITGVNMVTVNDNDLIVDAVNSSVTTAINKLERYRAILTGTWTDKNLIINSNCTVKLMGSNNTIVWRNGDFVLEGSGPDTTLELGKEYKRIARGDDILLLIDNSVITIVEGSNLSIIGTKISGLPEPVNGIYYLDGSLVTENYEEKEFVITNNAMIGNFTFNSNCTVRFEDEKNVTINGNKLVVDIINPVWFVTVSINSNDDITLEPTGCSVAVTGFETIKKEELSVKLISSSKVTIDETTSIGLESGAFVETTGVTTVKMNTKTGCLYYRYKDEDIMVNYTCDANATIAINIVNDKLVFEGLLGTIVEYPAVNDINLANSSLNKIEKFDQVTVTGNSSIGPLKITTDEALIVTKSTDGIKILNYDIPLALMEFVHKQGKDSLNVVKQYIFINNLPSNIEINFTDGYLGFTDGYISGIGNVINSNILKIQGNGLIWLPTVTKPITINDKVSSFSGAIKSFGTVDETNKFMWQYTPDFREIKILEKYYFDIINNRFAWESDYEVKTVIGEGTGATPYSLWKTAITSLLTGKTQDEALLSIGAQKDLEHYCQDFVTLLRQSDLENKEESNTKQILLNLCDINLDDNEPGLISATSLGGTTTGTVEELILTDDIVFQNYIETTFTVGDITFVVPNRENLVYEQQQFIGQFVNYYASKMLAVLQEIFGQEIKKTDKFSGVINVSFAVLEEPTSTLVDGTINLKLPNLIYEDNTKFTKIFTEIVKILWTINRDYDLFAIANTLLCTVGDITVARTVRDNPNPSLIFMALLDRAAEKFVDPLWCAIFVRWLFRTVAQEQGWNGGV